MRPNVVRFTGGIHDETTGLTKVGRRCYDPNLDRFTRQDTPTSSLERRSFASALGGNGGRMNRGDPWRPRMSWGLYTLGVVGCTLVAASTIFIVWLVLRSGILLLLGGSALILASSVMHVWRLMRK